MSSSTAPSNFGWKSAWLVGQAQLDSEHQEFAELIAALQAASDGSLFQCLDAVISHAIAHFGQEDAWMRRLDFPAQQCHMAEHAAVLRSAAGVRQLLRQGDAQPARRFATELAAWFPPHVQHLDSALAAWICKQTWNAKPLVFQRRSHLETAPSAPAMTAMAHPLV